VNTIYIITEYCSSGELFDYIITKRKINENEACRIFQQLIAGVEYLHKMKIVHRDLKPENLLFDYKKDLKIADFGLSNQYDGLLATPCGSPCYAAPEMVQGKKYEGSAVDIWSCGIILFTMVCGYLPFEDENQERLFIKIAKGSFTIPSHLSPNCRDLLKNILNIDPNKRYHFAQIKQHPWFQAINNTLGMSMYFNSPGLVITEYIIPVINKLIKM
jgi:5'-AMP-activated protein kinase catalytic alpha subunit